jgi:dihydrofolate reductase
MYETMLYWETFDASEDQLPCLRDFTRIWLAADKVVYSTTLAEASSARTQIERTFDPEAVLRMKETLGHDISVGGAQLAGQAIAAGLVDEIHLFVTPVTLGGGNSALPEHFRTNLELLSMDRFACGVVHLQYRIAS